MSASNEVTVEALAAKLEQLGQVCAGLRREVAELRNRPSGPPAAPAPAPRRKATPGSVPAPAVADPGQPAGRTLSRRMMGKALGAAAASVVGAAALVDLGSAPAGAASGDAVLAGEVTKAEDNTTLQFDGQGGSASLVLLVNDSTLTANDSTLMAALAGWAGGPGGTTVGVYGLTEDGDGFGVFGVNPRNGAGAGVTGQADGNHSAGVSGANSTGVGVLGLSESANGVRGLAGGDAAGVNGDNSGVGPGVHGQSANGRGGQFAGAIAQVQLVPGTRPTHPTSGHAGDLYVDSTGRLWFCKSSGTHATWKQLA